MELNENPMRKAERAAGVKRKKSLQEMALEDIEAREKAERGEAEVAPEADTRRIAIAHDALKALTFGDLEHADDDMPKEIFTACRTLGVLRGR